MGDSEGGDQLTFWDVTSFSSCDWGESDYLCAHAAGVPILIIMRQFWVWLPFHCILEPWQQITKRVKLFVWQFP